MQKKFLFFKLFGILNMKDKKGESERTRKGERMYDFYFSKDFAYCICKVKGEENRREPGASLNLISDNQDYQISAHESDFYFLKDFAYYICKVKKRKIKTRKKIFYFLNYLAY